MGTKGRGSSGIVSASHNENQARLSACDDLDLCSSKILTAASPFGSEVRPVSMSLTEEGARPTSVPISAKVIPLSRRSVMRDAQGVMPPNIRQAVFSSQRLPVTDFRNNNGTMPRPADMPSDLDTPGKRIAWWRNHRGKTLKEVAAKAKCSPGSLNDFERGRSKALEQLHLVCAYLGLNAFYVDSGKGEPELNYPQEPPSEMGQWVLPAANVDRVASWDPISKELATYKINEILDKIEIERRQQRKAGT